MAGESVPPTIVVFVCLHGSAKSLIAAQHLNRLAAQRGLALGAESMGVEPDAEVPTPVIAGLARDGFDVRHYVPQPLEPRRLELAACVVTFGCDVPQATGMARLERWDDLPLVSDGFDRARDAIVARVERLVETFARRGERSATGS